MLDKIILGLLQDAPHTAYSLQKAMEASTGFFYGASQGNINPTLKRLEARNAISGQTRMVGARSKVEYSITRVGQQEFTDWVDGPIDVGRVKDDALVKLFFLGHADPEQRRIRIEAFRQELLEHCLQLKLLKADIEKKTAHRQLTEVERFRLETLNYGIDYYEFTSDWYKALLERRSL